MMYDSPTINPWISAAGMVLGLLVIGWPVIQKLHRLPPKQDAWPDQP